MPADMRLSRAVDLFRRRAFLIFGAMILIGLTAFVEFTIRGYQTLALDQIERVAVLELREFEQTHRSTIESRDQATFEGAALNRLRNPSLAFIHLALAGEASSWRYGSQAVGTDARSKPQTIRKRSDGLETRIQRHGRRMLLEASVPVVRGHLVIARDITSLLSDLRSTERQVRTLQACASALMMIGFWVAFRWASTARERAELSAPSGEKRTGDEDGPGMHSKARLKPGSTLVPTHSNPEIYTAPDSETGSTATISPHPALSTSYRLLVVEDNPVNRTVAVMMLERMGCEVECAEDGIDCLEMLEDAAYDLIFMDIQMPRLDGLEATRRIRQIETEGSLRPTPIIALTAHSQPQDRMAAHRAGMNDHISKPFTEIDLLEALRTHCESKSAWSP